ncbi:hypothetical protein BKA65DRAFT_516518 [Rhexocercosporidium sp. MPI-PUGE-AT-0058]|nr:hypothetical protein BKA65DRAFT_516518 [Rhexocercosporidium sp. MPI-PUGE-AT-0058]
MTFKNVIVAGASGTIGSPIVAALLSSGQFKVSALSRPTSKATFPPGVTIKRADLSSRSSLVTALRGQDVLICTLNDEAAQLQGGLIEAAYEAGVKRYMPNEWASHDMIVEGTPMEEVYEGKRDIVRLLDEKVEVAGREGREFCWTALNTGVFFDWALQASFLDIGLPPTSSAKIWDSGDSKFSVTILSTVGQAVVAILTTAEETTRNKLIEIESFSVSQNEIVAALEKVTGTKWELEKTSSKEQLDIAGGSLEKGEFLEAFYIWVRAWIFSGKEGAKLVNAKEGNELLDVGGERLEDVVGKVVRGEIV